VSQLRYFELKNEEIQIEESVQEKKRKKDNSRVKLSKYFEDHIKSFLKKSKAI